MRGRARTKRATSARAAQQGLSDKPDLEFRARPGLRAAAATAIGDTGVSLCAVAYRSFLTLAVAEVASEHAMVLPRML